MSSSLRRLLRFPCRLAGRPFSSSSASTAADPDPTAGTNPKPRTRPKGLEHTVDSLFKERNLDRLISRFKDASASHRFRCKHRIYDVAVRRLAGAGRLDGVAEILDAQKQYPDDIAHEGFAARLIGLYGTAGMAAAAEATFRQLPALGCRRTVMSFNALLTACAEAGDFNMLDKMFSTVPVEEPEIVPNEVSYNIVVGSACKRNDLDAAMRVLATMEERGLQPSLISFNMLLNGYYKDGRFSEAGKVWDKMAVRNCKPDVRSFNAMMRGMVMEGRTRDAVQLLEELPSRGLKPDIYSFNVVIKGHCQDGNLDVARKVFEDLPKNDCGPNRETFETLVPVLSQSGQLDLALRMCKESMSRKCYVPAELLQGVVDGLVNDLRIEAAKELVKLARLNCYSKKSLRMPASPLQPSKKTLDA